MSFATSAKYLLLIIHHFTVSCAVFLLSAAAILKASHLEQGSSFAFDRQGLVNVVLPIVELALAVWLMSGIYQIAARRTTAAAFGAFAVYNIISSLKGHQSCGCFGELNIPPPVMAVLDAGICLSLFAMFNGPWVDGKPAPHASIKFLGHVASPVALFIAAALPSLALAGVDRRIECGTLVSISRETVLRGDPRTLDAMGINLRSRASRVMRVFLVVDFGCASCREFLEQFLASVGALSLDIDLTVIATAPDDLNATLLSNAGIKHRVLPRCMIWFDRTPCILFVQGSMDREPFVTAETIGIHDILMLVRHFPLQGRVIKTQVPYE